MGAGISCVHDNPRFFALIQIITVCKIVRNLSFPASGEPIAFVYLSACSQDVVKSMHSVPKIVMICSLKFFAGLNGVLCKRYGNLTRLGRTPGNGSK